MARLLIYKNQELNGVVVLLDKQLKDSSGNTYYSGATLEKPGSSKLELISSTDERIINSKQHHSYLYPYLKNVKDRQVLGNNLLDFYQRNKGFLK